MISRRSSIFALAAAPAVVSGASARSQTSSAPAPAPARTLPQDFGITGTYLNAAYTHPMPLRTAAAIKANADSRADPGAPHGRESRPAKSLFARLINATPAEIALVPSTSYGESFVVGALGLLDDRQMGVVTDILHFDGSLYMYGELAKQGTPVTLLPAAPDGRIDLNRVEAAVKPGVRLVAVSLVSMINGFQPDLKALCEIAHRRGAHVYVDAIQGAGATPIDVRATGVDFLACSSFKWLMGDFGCGFLYVREDLLPQLRRTQFGYHQPTTLAYHAFPGDPAGAALFEAAPEEHTAAGKFEVGSTSIAAEIGVGVSLQAILDMGVDRIAAHRAPLMGKLRTALQGRGFKSLTPEDSISPIVSYVYPDAAHRLRPRLVAAGVNVQTYANRFRVSPSVYNTTADIDRLLSVLESAPPEHG